MIAITGVCGISVSRRLFQLESDITLTQTLRFHRTRRTLSSNSLRFRRRYSASSVSFVISCVGALKSFSCNSLASRRICSEVICKKTQNTSGGKAKLTLGRR